MSDEELTEGSGEPKTEKVIKAGNSQYFFDLNERHNSDVDDEDVTDQTVVVEGERTLVSLSRMPAGDKSGRRSQPNEKFLYVLEGKLHFEISDQEALMSEGSLAYVPPDIEHSSRVISTEDALIFTGEDLRSSNAVDEAQGEGKTAEADESTESMSQETLTEGGIKAGDGDYFFELGEIEGIDAGPEYTTAHGTVIEGERILVGLMRSASGSGARLHTHPNEQFSYWVQGESYNLVDDKEADVSKGMLRYVPPEMKHKSFAKSDEDVYFFTVKDRTHSIRGIPVDKSTDSAYYESGFESDER